MLSKFETLLVHQPHEHVLMVELNRPEAANAFTFQMARELYECFEALAMTPGDTRAVVITGSGDRAFCAGGDLKERDGLSDVDWRALHLNYERMTRALLAFPLPLIAAVNGAAFGGGCEIVAACDFAYASDAAVFGQTEVKLGIIPGAGGTQTLPRAVGERRAKELILTGRRFSADQAYEYGLVQAVLPATKVKAAALEAASEIAQNAPVAVRQAKLAIARGADVSLSDGLAIEIEAYNHTIPTNDRREGLRAFVEKRSPKFTGD